MTSTKLETIRNILAKAEDAACPPPEAEALTAMAAKLMAKYGIEAAMLAATIPAQRKAVTNRRIVCEAPYATEKAGLIYGLAEAMGSKGVMLNEKPNGGRVIHLFGFDTDLERAEMLYTSLLLQSVNAMIGAEYAGQAAHAQAYGHMKAWRRSFLAGFNGAVVSRVKDAEKAARGEAQAFQRPDAPSVALVVADRSREVAQAFTEVYPRVRSRSTRLTGSGGSAGRAAGQRASIGGRAVAGGRAQIGA